ncbi:capZ-interacting protein isoform X1 [Manis javanica]|uniref:capZ-interacting protein isoform X1 n=1 Tax=Manis javanica TaxID=9974 RepID=UPI003C6D4DB0
MEERPADPNTSVDNSASPSVAQLAGRFREQAAAAKETPASKPARRKPPCSLPLFPPKAELGQNGEEKSLPNASHPPKIKVKSSPLIEKLQANLAFDPTALLPGASPKSPGLKAGGSPFQSPPSTPSSPGVRSRASEPEEVPVSFDQPPEGSHLPCYNKVRTRGSIKRRPPSRRFRRSQSDCGEPGDVRASESSQENGAQEENGDEVFPPKSKAPGPPAPSEGTVGEEVVGNLRSPEKTPPRTPSRTEKQEEKDRATEGGPECRKAERRGEGEATEPQAASPEVENGCESPTEEEPSGELADRPAEKEAERAGCGEAEPTHRSWDAEGPEGEASQSTPGGVGHSHTPKQGGGDEQQERGTLPEPGCSDGSHTQLETSSKVPGAEEKQPGREGPEQDGALTPSVDGAGVPRAHHMPRTAEGPGAAQSVGWPRRLDVPRQTALPRKKGRLLDCLVLWLLRALIPRLLTRGTSPAAWDAVPCPSGHRLCSSASTQPSISSLWANRARPGHPVPGLCPLWPLCATLACAPTPTSPLASKPPFTEIPAPWDLGGLAHRPPPKCCPTP